MTEVFEQQLRQLQRNVLSIPQHVFKHGIKRGMGRNFSGGKGGVLFKLMQQVVLKDCFKTLNL